MIQSQPNTEEIFKILSEAKEYHRETIIKLIQAKAPGQCLSYALEVLNILDAAAIASSEPTPVEKTKEIDERLSLIEDHIGIGRIVATPLSGNGLTRGLGLNSAMLQR